MPLKGRFGARHSQSPTAKHIRADDGHPSTLHLAPQSAIDLGPRLRYVHRRSPPPPFVVDDGFRAHRVGTASRHDRRRPSDRRPPKRRGGGAHTVTLHCLASRRPTLSTCNSNNKAKGQANVKPRFVCFPCTRSHAATNVQCVRRSGGPSRNGRRCGRGRLALALALALAEGFLGGVGGGGGGRQDRTT
jgi:hypothetical protein